MIYFRSDYSTGAHPEILKAINDSNFENHDGYGIDSHSHRAEDMIKDLAGAKDSEVYFFTGGTLTNLTSVAAFLRPHEAVLAPSSSHIFVHETGAIEGTGHKIFTFDTADGKLNPDHIDKAIAIHEDEHMVKPKLVYISNSTEIGTIYSLDDLKKLRAKCDEYNMYLYMDGARIGSALTCEANDLSLNDLVRLTDAFYIGGTKNGLLFGEALLINKPDLVADFRYIMKQKGAMLAKGRLIGLQFEAAFKDGLYFTMAEHANRMAKKLRSALKEKGYRFEIDSPSNQIFPIFSREKVEDLEKKIFFYRWHSIDSSLLSIRLVTEWTTKEEDVDAFIGAL